MIRLLTSPVWGNVPKGVYQEYGPTTVPGEPYSYRDKTLWHCGMDIGDLGIGWPLHAARGGLVVSVGWGQLGIQVGTETDWYIHIDSACVSLGQQVARNQLVAYSGGKVPSGGVIYGAHLHFEVQMAPPPFYNRPLTSVDPEPMLVALFGGGGNELTVKTRRTFSVATAKSLHQFCRGTDKALYHRKRSAGAWSAWKSLGGTLSTDVIGGGLDETGALVVTVVDSNAAFVDITSADDGATWSAYSPSGGGGDGLLTISAGPAATGSSGSVDLSPTGGLAWVKTELDMVAADAASIKRRVEKDLAP